MEGKAPEVEFSINDNTYHQGYYLANGIYPDWETLIKSFQKVIEKKRYVIFTLYKKCLQAMQLTEILQLFSAVQEALRKDVERTFAILFARFVILNCPARLWDIADLQQIVYCSVILHNMQVKKTQRAGQYERDIPVYLDNARLAPEPTPGSYA